MSCAIRHHTVGRLPVAGSRHRRSTGSSPSPVKPSSGATKLTGSAASNCLPMLAGRGRASAGR